MATKKRTIDAFFSSPLKKSRLSSLAGSTGLAAERGNATGPITVSARGNEQGKDDQFAAEAETKSLPNRIGALSEHPTYPFAIPHFPHDIATELDSLPATIGKEINDQPHLDLLYFQPYVPKYMERRVFEFLRSELPFYRVRYRIQRGGLNTEINTPRWTTVFGLDETSRFNDKGEIVTTASKTRVTDDKHYNKYPPRPIPQCLDSLRKSTEAATGCKFNFCLVNYYASGADSISYHSDDERFLGKDPAIASFTFGAARDFLMKHKPPPKKKGEEAEEPDSPKSKPLKLPLGSGDMILMRGQTQSNWLHSIPKRTGKNAEDGGRINITFRKALVREGTENYYNYNVGTGPVYKWDDVSKEMRPWSAQQKSDETSST